MLKSNLTAILSITITTLLLMTVPAFGDDALYIDENGNVGIGTNSPAVPLHIYETSNLVDLRLESDTGQARITFDGYITSDAAISALNFLNDGDSVANIQVYREGADDAGNIRFYTQPTGGSSTERIRITSTGNIGIGTSSPSDPLQVYTSTDTVAIYGRNTATNSTNYGIRGYATGAGGANVGMQGTGYGATTASYGVFGYACGTSVNYGIFGQTNNGGTYNYAGFFSGDVYITGNCSFASFTDRTPFYEGDALSEIAKISGKDGEIDHSTLPDFAHATQEVPVFEESELTEISPDNAFETVMVEQAKLVETTNDKGDIVKYKIQKGVKTESRGYKVEDGNIVEILEETPVYETETIKKTQLKKDVYLDEQTGKVYQKTGDGEIFEKDGKIYQRNQTGIEIEDQRDLGAMISILTVAVQQLNKENEELRQRIAILESISK